MPVFELGSFDGAAVGRSDVVLDWLQQLPLLGHMQEVHDAFGRVFAHLGRIKAARLGHVQRRQFGSLAVALDFKLAQIESYRSFASSRVISFPEFRGLRQVALTALAHFAKRILLVKVVQRFGH